MIRTLPARRHQQLGKTFHEKPKNVTVGGGGGGECHHEIHHGVVNFI